MKRLIFLSSLVLFSVTSVAQDLKVVVSSVTIDKKTNVISNIVMVTNNAPLSKGGEEFIRLAEKEQISFSSEEREVEVANGNNNFKYSIAGSFILGKNRVKTRLVYNILKKEDIEGELIFNQDALKELGVRVDALKVKKLIIALSSRK